MLKDKRNGERRLQELDDQTDKLNEEIEEYQESIRNTERIISEEEHNQTEWNAAMNLIDEDLAKLETELLDELEETIVEEIEVRSKVPNNSDNDEATAEDIYEMQGFYWGGEDCCEMIFFDDQY